MFETLSGKLTTSLRKVRGIGRLSDENIGLTLNEVKMALLEADVNYRVVKAFLRSVTASLTVYLVSKPKMSLIFCELT